MTLADTTADFLTSLFYSIGQMSIGQMSVGQMSVSQMSVGMEWIIWNILKKIWTKFTNVCNKLKKFPDIPVQSN